MAAQQSGGATPPGESELVFALCHEIGNLLAAGRLEAALLAGTASANVADASRRLSEITAWAGSLLALVRPLLDPDPAAALATDPEALLAGLRSGLDEATDEHVAIDAEGELPDVVVAADVLHHLLLVEVFAGLAASDRVRVTARAEAGRVDLAVEHPASAPPRGGEEALRGPTLARAVAGALLGRNDGRVAVEHGAGFARVVFSFPALSP